MIIQLYFIGLVSFWFVLTIFGLFSSVIPSLTRGGRGVASCCVVLASIVWPLIVMYSVTDVIFSFVAGKEEQKDEGE